IKGEIAIASGRAVRRVVFGAGGYVVPRGADLLVGATSEDAGFDAGPTAKGLATLDGIARTLLAPWPRGEARFAARYAGLRPVTPDLLPILGADPDVPALLYACGYSRNGILLAPLAAECIAALASGEGPAFDLSPFRADRFPTLDAPG
ncbi:MAG TPA: FAD-dependent oxidoreductase, partial [Gemmatimonadaceae bacterium]|nr:FAD-dependent oxidoreductase [Gemmatimonadaceae bacterium]